MEIIASYSFFIHMNVNEFKQKIHLIKNLNLSFDIRLLEVNTYDIKRN